MPVASARGMTVLWVPFLAFTGEAWPRHCEQWMQAARPARGTLLIANGTGPQPQPRRSAAAPNASRIASEASGGIG